MYNYVITIINRSQFLSMALLFMAGLTLGACIPGLSAKESPIVYTIRGLQDYPDAQDYVQEILDRHRETEWDANNDLFDIELSYQINDITDDLGKALKAQGFYDAQIKAGRVYTDSEKPEITFTISSGPRYIISEINLPDETDADFNLYNHLNTGEPLIAERVLLVQRKLHDNLRKGNCYFSLDVSHSVTLNKDEYTARIDFSANSGPQAVFGETTFTGLDKVKPSFLQKLVPWQEGDCFDRGQIRKLQTRLLETGLFAKADYNLPEELNNDNKAPITFAMKERSQRTIKAGLSYYTDEGAGITLGWQHRNFFGSGENFEARLKLNQINQVLEADFSKPYFLRKDQSLNVNSSLLTADTDAFEETTLNLGGAIKREITENITASLGAEMTFSEVTDKGDTETYGLLSFPANAVFDNRNDSLNPVEGWYLSAGIEPFYDMLDKSDPFNRFDLGARTYLEIDKNSQTILALRANIGSILGGSTEDIPASERFYAGGGGSVRGFGFQEVGPFENGDPLGGRSSLTGSMELRSKFSDTLGGVAFFDAGSVSDSALPDFDEPAFGAGVGVRYYTDFGPLRFDVAVPLNQKENLDQNYQLYISIGQAF